MSPRTSSATVLRNGQSPRTAPTVRTMAMASPAPLPPPTAAGMPIADSSEMSVTGLLSPNPPGFNLTNELSDVMDLNSFFEELEHEVLGTSPDRN